MLAAVSQEAAGYEGLKNYIVGGGRPTDVRAFDASARQPAGEPGSALPGAPSSIPTSSAHPGKQTNQRITYARLVTKFPCEATGGLDPKSIYEGDVVFVHRYDGMNQGYDTNKPTRMATISQLNAMLVTYDYPSPYESAARNTDLGHVTMPAQSITGYDNARQPVYETNDPRGDQDKPTLPLPPVVRPPPSWVARSAARPNGSRPAVPTPEWLAYDQVVVEYEADLEVHGREVEANRVGPLKQYLAGPFAEYEKRMHVYKCDYPKHRWKHCTALSEWTLDGICCGTEHEHGADAMVGPDGSNPGELYNVAIGGPTLMRNAANHKHNMDAPEQHIDDGLRTLDKVFVGLICYEQRDEDVGSATHQQVTHYQYQYKAFTSRQIAWASFQRSVGVGRDSYACQDALVPGAINTAGPTVGDFQRMCCVWRVGSILDTCAGMSPYKCATINVVVEEWPLSRLSDEYNRFFGGSFYLAKLIMRQLERRALLQRARELLFDGDIATPLVQYFADANDDLQEWVRVDGINLAQIADQVRAWRTVDRESKDQEILVRMRWETADPVSEDPDYRQGPYGPVPRPMRMRPRARDVGDLAGGARFEDAPGTFDVRASRDGQLLYEPASGEAAALHERMGVAQWTDALVNVAAPDLAAIGRTAALFDTTTPGDPDYLVIQAAEVVHTHWLGVRAALKFWKDLRDAEGDWLWPLRP